MSAADQIPADARRSLRIYNACFPFVFLALLPGLLRRMFRRGHFRDKFGQRLALYSEADRARIGRGQGIWIHSISVGETLIALKLARALRQQDRSVQVTLSVTTSTGFALAREAEEEWLVAIYNPIDFASVIREALDTIRPSQLILIEGEVWPNLVAECARRAIPVSLVNARLSPRSEGRFRRFRKWTAPIFGMLERVCVPELGDEARWIALGVDAARIHRTGSIKLDHAGAVHQSRVGEFQGLLEAMGVSAQTPILLGGSTWDPEEKILARISIELRRSMPALLVILVPRHVERTPAIVRELESLGLQVCRRSHLPHSPPSRCDVLIVDTTGELRDWYELATVVFVGKSLAVTGGQNPGEPALLGKPVVFGPHMENFSALVDLLLAQEAAVQVTDEVELAEELRTLFANAARRESLGKRALYALESHRGAAERTANLLLGD